MKNTLPLKYLNHITYLPSEEIKADGIMQSHLNCLLKTSLHEAHHVHLSVEVVIYIKMAKLF